MNGHEPTRSQDDWHGSMAADLPQSLTSFVGRAAHVADVSARLQQPEVRLLTLVGPAGVGKTRVALAAAELASSGVPDGARYVPCASLRNAQELAHAIAEVFNLHATSTDSIESRVINHLRGRGVLLVLDNLEHILPVPFVTRFLTACQQVKVLATSRTVLHLSGEHEYIVPPMELPDPGQTLPLEELAAIESVALIVDRARQVAPAFAVTTENATDLAAICIRLDGLPLAIELAAARLKVFSPGALLDRLSDRLALLVGGPSDQPPHQRTIRDTIGWSYDLLTPREQRAFRRLAVFSGGIPPNAASRVCHDGEIEANDAVSVSLALDELTSLCDQSLLQQVKNPADGPRFFMLETVRAYALDQLRCNDELEHIRDRHARYYVDFVESATQRMLGADQETWAKRIEQELPDIRDALQALRASGDAERYTRLACAMFKFWRMRGTLIEGRSWMGPALTTAWTSKLPADLRAKAFTNAGWLAWEQGDTPHATEYGEEALAISSDAGLDTGMARAYSLLSIIDTRLGENHRALARMELSLKHHRLAEDLDNVAGTLNNLALLAMEADDFERAAELCAESRRSFAALDNPYGESHAIDNRGVALYCLGRFEEAVQCSRDSLAIARRLEDKRGIAISLDHKGKCARALGDLVAAWEAHEESLPYRRDLGDPRGLLTWLEAMALWMVEADQPAPAVTTLGAVEVVRIGSRIPLQRHEIGDHVETVALARASLGDTEFEMLFARGRWQSLDETVDAMYDAARLRAAELTRDSARQAATVARYGLTPREQDVALLIEERYSDKEIAEALFISHRTVARHVASIFDKLDVHTRREATERLNAPLPVSTP